MKLQKLVYCSYGWWLAGHGLDEVRLTSEGPQIWKHGPVFDSLYHTLKVFGREPITLPQSSNPFGAPDMVDAEDESVLNLVRWVWGRYGHLSSFALSDMTHKPGTPWHRVAVENNFRIAYNTSIPDQYILEEYQRLMNFDNHHISTTSGSGNGQRRTTATA
ncbi:UNVERIFIED_ORG: putative phage-associated protein [Agrobacterium larrymoorei]|nr:putative phage-associated protein [Agrobacterium larrymoorei]